MPNADRKPPSSPRPSEGSPRPEAPAVVTGVQLNREEVSVPHRETEWLDRADPVMAAFAALYGSALLPTGQDRSAIYRIQRADVEKLRKWSEELHAMFLHATEHVLLTGKETDPLHRKFNIPDRLWPAIRRSWKEEPLNISGRFDFALGAKGPKVFEYNADSAAALVECAVIQDRWANALGLEGADVGSMVSTALGESWEKAQVRGLLHLMCDDDPEERLHTTYMRSVAEARGIVCKTLVGTEGLRFDPEGRVMDADGEPIRNVWKTWSWMTVLTRCTADEERTSPDLPDVLLRDPAEVRVWEPLWTVIMSSKALLPVLCELYPKHPLLLPCEFTPSSRMLNSTGFAVKPVHGRCGENVTLVGPNARFIEERRRRPTSDTAIYQELYLLPRYGPQTVQLSCFLSRGRYVGPVLRVESGGSRIITQSSECVPLRVFP